ncbi:MAG: hypothetical protein IKB98_05570 [Clostridia bacterium]|nr:hypothetical protein [Clostridia bacterium]
MQVHRFNVLVNCSLDKENNFQKGKILEELYEDNGFIILPDEYTESGAQTRLVISCHGAGGTVTTDDSQVEHQAMTEYLVANGFAVMDVNGLPQKFASEKGIDIRNNIGSPIAVRSYVKAYHYCMEHFNLKTEVFVHGGSMGGISSTNLVLSGEIPVVSHTAFCPVLDTYNQIFLHPWSGGLPRDALGIIYDLEVNEKGEYVYDEQKIMGYNPVKNPKSKDYPVPVKFWHCEDDGTVDCSVTKEFVKMINENGGKAELRTFEHGGHEPQLAGEKVLNPVGKHIYQGKQIEIFSAVEEAFSWIKKFDK